MAGYGNIYQVESGKVPEAHKSKKESAEEFGIDIDHFDCNFNSAQRHFEVLNDDHHPVPQVKFVKHSAELFECLEKLGETIDELCQHEDGNHDLMVKAFHMEQSLRLEKLQTLINEGAAVDADPTGGVKLLMKARPDDLGERMHQEIMWHLIHCWQAAKAIAHASVAVVEAFNKRVTDFDQALKNAEKHFDILHQEGIGSIKLKKNMVELFECLAKIAHTLKGICEAEDGNHGLMARCFDQKTGRLKRLKILMSGGSDFNEEPRGGVRLKMNYNPETFGESAHTKTMDDLENWFSMAFATASSEFLKHMKNK